MNEVMLKNFYPGVLGSDEYVVPNIYFLPAKENNYKISKNFYPDILNSDKHISPNIYFLPNQKLQNDTLKLSQQEDKEKKNFNYKKYLMVIGSMCTLAVTYFAIKKLAFSGIKVKASQEGDFKLDELAKLRKELASKETQAEQTRKEIEYNQKLLGKFRKLLNFLKGN